jgi:TolB protein
VSRLAKLGAIAAAAVAAAAGAAGLALLRDDDGIAPAGQSDVFSVDVATGEVRKVTESEASEYLLSPSPDGRRVAFFAGGAGQSALYVMDIDGSNRRELASGAPAGGPLEGMHHPPAWSPDGKSIAFDRSRRCRDIGCEIWEVMLVDVEDGTVRRIADEARGPTWSPDGTLLALEAGVRGEGFGSRVDVMQPDGSGRRSIALGRKPLWSPRGDLIAYERSGVRVVRPDGSGARRLVGVDVMESPVAWSPDGSRLAFPFGEGNDQDLFWASVDGPQLGRLTRLRGPDANPSWSPDGRLLAWSHELGPDETDGIPAWYLYGGSSDGSPPRRLVTALYRGSGEPAWTPDGAQVLYTAEVDPRVRRDPVDIHSVGADGGAERVMRTPIRESLPAASPDGDRLAFYAEEESGSYLYVSDADGGGRRRLAEGGDSGGPYVPVPPAWSPDGSTLAFVRDFGCANRLCTTWEIWLVRADGSGLRRLVTGGREPHWSPDGRRIAYTGLDGYIYVISASGIGRHRLRRGFLPQWSPRGDYISYIRWGLFTELWVARADGSGSRRLVAEVETLGYAWSPNARRLAFASYGRRADQDIFAVNVETTAARPLVRQRGSDDGPTFSPDGNQIAWINLPNLEGEQRNFIYVARADGTAARRVTKKPQVIVDPLTWSANGRIYFTVLPGRAG